MGNGGSKRQGRQLGSTQKEKSESKENETMNRVCETAEKWKKGKDKQRAKEKCKAEKEG